ncbi:hypothetical protein ONE63_008166 [Megalurothrips usitatus]|uniref:EGF-like domain-containing protein n=1 Tax=Megalurothrips usitatus TaxID=439358 RepID=A0AAV7XPI3_9NEOP|nr:hypothetical protein ONE63_008166 [Megalurothrips usitatus]
MLLLAVLAAVIGLGGVSPTGLVQNPRSAAVIQLKLEETDAETTISSTGEFTSSMIEEPKRRINMTGDSYDGWTTIGWDARNRTVGEPVAVGEVVRFQLNATPNVKSKIRMGLCGGQCSVVTSWGISRGPRPQLGHITWVSRSSDINDNMNSHDLKSYTGPWSFASEPYHTFAVERRTETQMVVWAEIDGQRSDEVLLPLTADRDKLFVSSFVGPYRFLSSSNTESKVLTRRTAPGLLVSPLLPGARGGGQHWLCFEVEHGKADTTRDPQPGLLITAEDVHGSRRAVALVQHQSEGWTNSRVLIPWSSEPWRLIISGPPSSMVQAMGECDHSKDDPVQVGELGGEYKSPDAQFVPFNFSSLPKRGPYRADRDAEECFNGGRFNGSGCFCEPGFMGSRCERACTPGFVGDNCDVKCKERLKCTEDESLCSSNCWGSLVCDEIGHCRCAPGFKGERCQTPPEFSPPPHTFVICRRIVGWFALARRTVGTFCRATKAQSNPWRLVPKFSNGQGELNAPHTMGKYGKYLKKYSSTWEKEASLKGWLTSNSEENVLNGQPEAFCKVCQQALRAHHADLLKHTTTAKHLANARKFDRKTQPSLHNYGAVEVSETAKFADLKLAVFIATHCSVNTIDHLGELLNELGAGSPLEKVRCHRTKCSKLIENVIAPTFLKELVDDVGDSPFSLIVDEVTDNSTSKFMGVCVRYFSQGRGRMITDFLGLILVRDCTGAALAAAVVEFLRMEVVKLPLQNLQGVGVDGASNMCGQNNSFYTHLKKQVPHLMLFKCVCHSIDKCAEHAYAKLPADLSDLLDDTNTWFNKSAKKWGEYCDYYKTSTGKNPKKLVSRSKTRWLVWVPCSDVIIDQWFELKGYFTLKGEGPQVSGKSLFSFESYISIQLCLTSLSRAIERQRISANCTVRAICCTSFSLDMPCLVYKRSAAPLSRPMPTLLSCTPTCAPKFSSLLDEF